jgi:RNA recognition motif-containing protein
MSARARGTPAHGWPEVTYRGHMPTWNGHFNDPLCDAYIRGFPPHFRERDLFHLASSHGTILQARVLYTVAGNSKCCGFVKCATHEDQEKVIRALHGLQIAGSHALEARPWSPEPTRGA